ncbi:hypothetical protein Tco_0675208 [Tanacetum coccineum]
MKTDMVKREVEIETVGECVDEIDKLAELIGEMQLKQEDSRGCVSCINELHLHSVHSRCSFDVAILLEWLQLEFSSTYSV